MGADLGNWQQQSAAAAAAAKADPAVHLQQVQALRHGVALAPLTNFRLIRIEGDDAQNFLQGQLSSDIRELDTQGAQYSTYSTAKGRMLASFLIWSHQGAYYLLVAADVADAIIKRLSMFVMRAKVKVSAADAEWMVLGMNDAAAETVLPGFKPAAALQLAAVGDGWCLTLPHGGYLLLLKPDSALLPALPANAWVAPEVWALRDIDAGIAWVCLATQEQFVPQMANMELIGAVSFKKGCYPGQEIVARTQYLGKVKRRLFKVTFNQALDVGAKLYSPDTLGQAIGMLAAICQVGINRFEGLAVVQAQAWAAGVFADEAANIPLQRLELPYATEVAPD